jgi:hypothetical protein
MLDYETLEALASALKCNRSETRTLILLGLLEHGPDQLRSCVFKLIEDLTNCTERLNIELPNLDFSGKHRKTPAL